MAEPALGATREIRRSPSSAVPIVTSGVVPSTFVNTSLTQSDLTLNAAGNFAGRLEQTALAAKLRPNQQFAKVTYIDSGGDSYYHSGQATLRKRFGDGLQAGLAYTLGKSIDDYNSRRPSNALAIVTSSAYSKSPPTGNPNARRVTRIPSGLIKRDKYRAVVSPSTFGFVATITSSTLPECNR